MIEKIIFYLLTFRVNERIKVVSNLSSNYLSKIKHKSIVFHYAPLTKKYTIIRNRYGRRNFQLGQIELLFFLLANVIMCGNFEKKLGTK